MGRKGTGENYQIGKFKRGEGPSVGGEWGDPAHEKGFNHNVEIDENEKNGCE